MAHMNNSSPFAGVPAAPPDPILGLTEAYIKDPRTDKVNLGVGVYLDEHGKVPILRCVAEAQRRWIEREDSKSYLPIDGIKAYNEATRNLVLGPDSPAIAEGRAVTIQTLGGTGALRVGAEFIRRFLDGRPVAISTPSWPNHKPVFESAGLDVRQYPYYDPSTHGLDVQGMLAALQDLPDGSVVVLHACCHNPSGADPTAEQWDLIREVLLANGHIPFFDFAYQGLGDGLEQDAYAVRRFVAAGAPCLIASSYSKSFSLYRERVGALTIVTARPEETTPVLSQLKVLVRANVSNPPSFGGQVVSLVLNDPELARQWRNELDGMRLRIQRMRSLFVEALGTMGVGRDFRFIQRQKGMFSFLGLPVEAVRRLRTEFGIYAVDSSRICVAAMNEGNLERICSAIAAVIGT